MKTYAAVTAVLIAEQVNATLSTSKPLIKYSEEIVPKKTRLLRDPLVKDTNCSNLCFF